jgi:hypothetical protein
MLKEYKEFIKQLEAEISILSTETVKNFDQRIFFYFIS